MRIVPPTSVMETLPAYTVEQAAKLAGLSVRKVVYWADTDVFVPHYVEEDTRRPYSRLYSFRDLVGLRTLAQLRTRVSLQSLRAVGHWLRERYEAPWASLRFYVLGKDVLFDEPETGERVAPLRGRLLPITFELAPIARETRAAVVQLHQRDRGDIGEIVRHRHVLQNAWRVKGTRVPTAGIWNFHQAGYDTEAIIREYPRLTPADVTAAIEHEAAERAKQQRTVRVRAEERRAG
jgi:uncharacterized protein (DUF433 family)